MEDRRRRRAAGVALPPEPPSGSSGLAASAGEARLEAEVARLDLRHTWTTAMSSSDFRDVVRVRYTRDAVTYVVELDGRSTGPISFLIPLPPSAT